MDKKLEADFANALDKARKHVTITDSAVKLLRSMIDAIANDPDPRWSFKDKSGSNVQRDVIEKIPSYLRWVSQRRHDKKISTFV